MGAFCVFGISRVLCKAAATKKVSSYDSEERRTLTPAEWAVRRDELAEQLFVDATRSVRVSPELDAPQFCADWLAADPSQVRDAVIMVRGPKIDKHGGVVTRNGQPVESWRRHDPATPITPSPLEVMAEAC